MIALLVIISLSIGAQLIAVRSTLRHFKIGDRIAIALVFLFCILLFLLDRVLALIDAASGDTEATVASLLSAVTMATISFALAGFTLLVGPKMGLFHEANKRAQRERKFANNLIQTAPTFFVTIDASGLLVMMNRAMLTALGYEESEVIGKPYLETFVPEAERADLQQIFATLTSGHGSTLNQNHVIASNGEQRLVEWHGSPVFDGNGRFEYFFGIGIDRTQLAELEEQLRRAQRMEAIGRLAGGVAHDFNNLLTTIHGHAERLLAGSQDEAGRAASAKSILEESSIAAARTKQLLQLGQRQTADGSVLDLNDVVKSMRARVQALLGQGSELKLHIEEPIMNVLADRDSVEQIVLTLTARARDAMPDGGELFISTANLASTHEDTIRALDLLPGEYVRLTIADSGQGLGDEARKHLFEPFFAPDLGHAEGLGLPVVYGVVRSLGGSIVVGPDTGQGTRFDVYLRATRGIPTTELPAMGALSTTGGGELVLVVDDNAGVRDLSCTLLESAGYEVVSAADSSSAATLASAMEAPPDLLLTDVVMPGTSGRELAEKLRGLHPQMRVLYMSGYTNNLLSNLAGLPQGMHFIQKPFSAGQLLEQVQRALGHPDTED